MSHVSHSLVAWHRHPLAWSWCKGQHVVAYTQPTETPRSERSSPVPNLVKWQKSFGTQSPCCCQSRLNCCPPAELCTTSCAAPRHDWLPTALFTNSASATGYAVWCATHRNQQQQQINKIDHRGCDWTRRADILSQCLLKLEQAKTKAAVTSTDCSRQRNKKQQYLASSMLLL